MVDLRELSEVLFRGDVSRVKEITRRALLERIKEQGMVVCSFLKREIVILTKAKKGRYKVNEFKRETGSKKICGDGGIGSSEEFKFK